MFFLSFVGVGTTWHTGSLYVVIHLLLPVKVLELKGCIATLYPSAVKVPLVEDIGYMVHAYMLGVNKLMYGIHNTLFTKYTYCM